MADSARIDFTEMTRLIAQMGDRGRQALAATRPALAEILVTAVHEEFETEGRGRWPDLADSTKLGRR